MAELTALLGQVALREAVPRVQNAGHARSCLHRKSLRYSITKAAYIIGCRHAPRHNVHHVFLVNPDYNHALCEAI